MRTYITTGLESVNRPTCGDGKAYLLKLPLGAITVLVTLKDEIALFEITGAHSQPM